jgi:hypothetical protein
MAAVRSCPQCGSQAVLQARLLRIVGAILFLVLGTANLLSLLEEEFRWLKLVTTIGFLLGGLLYGWFAFLNPPLSCRKCGHRFA